MTRPGEVLEGRTLACATCNARRVCSSCGARIRYGKPNPNGRWESLRLSEGDWRKLAMAAAEFMELHREYEQRVGESIPVDAVEFADWVKPEVVEDAA